MQGRNPLEELSFDMMKNWLRRSNCNSRGWRCSKALFRITLISGFIWLMLWVARGGAAAEMAVQNTQGQQLPIPNDHHKSLEINFFSKRKVPNGPDPIHNRRAGNSHRPPGRA